MCQPWTQDIKLRVFLNQRFKCDYRDKSGIEFQKWFVEIAKRRFGSNFEMVKPAGPKGDLKCDGYLSDRKTIFQCYAPYEMTEKQLLKKIKSDFNGAIEHWSGIMNEWILVHNSRQGLTADVVKFFEELRQANPSIKIANWAEKEIFDLVCGLEIRYLFDIFGELPTSESFEKVKIEDISIVVNSIARMQPQIDLSAVKVPSPLKIEKNNLSSEVKGLLQLGLQKIGVVEECIESAGISNSGARLAESLRIRYQELKNTSESTDAIFEGLQQYVGFSGSVSKQIASMAVLAFFFESCDIFETTSETG